MSLVISQLYIYPIKSLGGISVQTSKVTDRGLENDHRWMLVNSDNQFLTIREYPKMTRLHLDVTATGLTIHAVEQGSTLHIPFGSQQDVIEDVTIWNATVKANPYNMAVNQWFSEMLGGACKLMYMPDHSSRPVDTTSGFHPAGKFTSFADAYPFLLLGEEAMNALNERSKESFSIMRFRPNLVFRGGYANQEDFIEDFTINGVRFTGFENCERCGIPCIDPETGIETVGKEPLVTLAKYRSQNRKIVFGRNVVHSNTGTISVGDELILPIF